MSAHTPGPWTARKSSGLNAYEIKAADGAYLADVWGVDVPIPNGVHPRAVKANARLIAKAPELYEAMKTLTEKICAMTSDEFARGGEQAERERARALLAEIDGTP